MKIQAFLILFVFYTNYCYSQITKNYWLVGGQLKYHYTKTTIDEIERTGSLIQGEPQAGYFVLDKFAAGIQVDLIRRSSKSSDIRSVATTVGVGPFAQ